MAGVEQLNEEPLLPPPQFESSGDANAVENRQSDYHFHLTPPKLVVAGYATNGSNDITIFARPLPGASDGTPAQKAYRFHWEGPMNAIALLKQQHRLVEQLFERFEATEAEDAQKTIFFEIADNLAVHATIEERWFYPAVRARQTEEQIEEAYDEHLDVKKLILEATRAIEDPGFDGRVAALKGAVEHHVEEEEEELFPSVVKLMTADALEALGQQMEAEAMQLMEAGEPRRMIHIESEAPAVQP